MNTKQLIASELASVIDSLDQEAILNLLEQPKNSDMGDIAFPAFTLAKVERKAPQMIAADIAEKINSQAFEKVVATGPYVNFFLDKNAISAQVLQAVITEKEHYADNHLGDWGKQFGMLIVAYKKWGNEEAVKAHPIDELLKLYVRINAEAENDPSLDEEAREWFRKLENGDEEALALWQWFRDESLVEFNRLYNELQVEFDSYNGEAFYNDKMDAVVDILSEKGLLVESEGAQVVNLEKYGIEHPALIKKSDGATLYITRDLAAALYRKNEYQFAKSIYVVGQEQSAHFKQLKAVLQEMGYDWSQDIVHVPFGLVTKEGKKLSTRKGNVILLEPTVAEAISRAKAQIEAKNPELENKDQVAHAVGVGAIKFYDLKTDRTNGYDFDLEAMVSFEGETGPYVQYAYARIQSILRKADFKPEAGANYSLNDAESWEIIKLIQDFPRIIKRAADNYEPSIIAKFAISLAQAFNKYYAHTRILDESPERDSRLALSYATAVVLKEALRLLGVEAPEKM